MALKERPTLPTPRDLWMSLDPGETVVFDENTKSPEPKQRWALLIRGWVIGGTISTERALDSLLIELIDPLKSNSAPQDEATRNTVEEIKLLINAAWLKANENSMRAKIAFLERTAKYHSALNEKEIRELAADLHKINNIRNDFAHRAFVVKQVQISGGRDYNVYLDYGNDKKLLNEAYIKEIGGLINKTMKKLEDITKSVH